MTPADVVDKLLARWLPRLPILSFRQAEFVGLRRPAMVELVGPLLRDMAHGPPETCDRPEVPVTGDTDVDFGARRREDVKVLAKWLARLPESTLESPSALVTKLRKSPLDRFITLRRHPYGAKQVYLSGWDETEKEKWRFYGPQDDDSHDALLRKAIFYAAGDAFEHWAQGERRAEAAARASRDTPLAKLLTQLGFAELGGIGDVRRAKPEERLSPGRLATLNLLVAEEEARTNLGRGGWHDANPWNGAKTREASWLLDHDFVEEVSNPYGGFPHFRTTAKGKAAATSRRS